MAKQIRVIGLVGTIASGKGVMAEYLAGQGYKVLILSDVIRQEIQLQGGEVTRKNLQEMGNLLREKEGADILVRRLREQLKSGKIVVDGIRNPAELEYLRKKFKALIVVIERNQKDRCNSYLQRARQRKEDKAEATDFELIDKRELGETEPSYGLRVQDCIELADLRLENEGSGDDLIKAFKMALDELGVELIDDRS